MMAIILAGGQGTRLRPYTMVIPKPLLPLGDVPILEVVVRQLAAAGYQRIVLTLGHMCHLFTPLFGDGSKYGVKIDYFFEERPLGTAGCLAQIPDLADDFLVLNGDVLTTLDFRSLHERHLTNHAWASIAVNSREVHIDYGVVKVDAQGALLAYIEKPAYQYMVSMGVNVLSKRALAYLPAAGKFDMPQLIDALRQNEKKVLVNQTDCYWQDIGRFEDYQQASADFVADPTRFFPKTPAPA